MMTKLYAVFLVLSASLAACSSDDKSAQVRGDSDSSADVTVRTSELGCYTLSEETGKPVVITSDASELLMPSFTTDAAPAQPVDISESAKREVLKPCS